MTPTTLRTTAAAFARYFTIWPRISPPLLAAVWTLTYMSPSISALAWASLSVAEPSNEGPFGRNGESNATPSSPSIRGYAEGTPQCWFHRVRERRRRRRVDGASQAGLVALRAAPRA